MHPILLYAGATNRAEGADKNLVPLSNEVGFCLSTKKEGSAGRSWQLFRWDDEVTRIYY